MTTIRRIYIFLVCLISLQWSVASLQSLVDAGIRWLLTTQSTEALWVLFPLAVLIVGIPIFIGHWAWEEIMARRDIDERQSLERHLYLSITIALLTAHLAYDLYTGVRAFFLLILPNATDSNAFLWQALAEVIGKFLAVLMHGALWAYHRYLSGQDAKTLPVPANERPGVIHFLINLGFAGLGMGFLASGTGLLFGQVLSLPDSPQAWNRIPVAFGLLAAGGVLWGYHRWGLAKDPSGQASFKVFLRWLSNQLFSFVGWVMATVGFVQTAGWLFAFFARDAESSLPVGLANLLSGTCVLIYHEWQIWLTSNQEETRIVKQIYALGLNLAGLGLFITGSAVALEWMLALPLDWGARIPTQAALLLPGLITWLYYEWQLTRLALAARWWQSLLLALPGLLLMVLTAIQLQLWLMRLGSGEQYPFLPQVLAWFFTGLPVYLYYEWLTWRNRSAENATLRWLQAWALRAAGVWMTSLGAIALLNWIFGLLSGSRNSNEFFGPFLFAGVPLWAYYAWVMHCTQGKQALLTRLAVYGFSGLGIMLTTYGLVGVQEWLITRLGGDPILILPTSLAILLTGLPLWLYFWRRAGRLFAGGGLAEQKSDLRKAYLYIIIYLAVHAAVITIGLLLNGLFSKLFGLPVSGNLGLPIGIITASVALWVYHALVLRRDIQKIGETPLQGRMQRLYWYLVASIGLLAVVLGLAGTLSGLVESLANLLESGGVPAQIRARLAGSLAALLAGAPVWASAWIPAQRAARHAQQVAMRRSILRKGYLYVYLFMAVVMILVFAVSLVYQLLNSILMLGTGENLLAEMAQSIGFSLLGLGLWVYHVWVLRADERFMNQEKAQKVQEEAERKAQEFQKLVETWSDFLLVVVDGLGGDFAETLTPKIRQRYPFLNVQEICLPTESDEALAALQRASLIICPWQLALPDGPVTQSPAQKLIILRSQENCQWVGVMPQAAHSHTILSALHHALPNRSADS